MCFTPTMRGKSIKRPYSRESESERALDQRAGRQQGEEQSRKGSTLIPQSPEPICSTQSPQEGDTAQSD
ncbi:uncharacterized [Tachysurus ichikawai]